MIARPKLLFILCYAFITSNAYALTYQDVARDKYGNPIRISNGDCLRTNVQTKTDPCQTSLKVVQRDIIIEEIMGMEERVIYFDFDSSELKEPEKGKVEAVADALHKHNIKAVKIAGYTDKIGSDGYNYNLSQKRANAVKRYLDSFVKLSSSIVEIRGQGKSHQIKDCSGIADRAELIECLAPNRRVEIEVDYKDKVKKVL